MRNEIIDVDGAEIREGTSIYDTQYDRVLWIAKITEYELKIQVANEYEDEEPIWWSADDDPTRVGDGTCIGIDKFESLVAEGRFEIGPQPVRRDG